MKIKYKISVALSSIALILLALCGVTLGSLYIDNTQISFLSQNKTFSKISVAIIVFMLAVLSFVFQSWDNKFVFKLTLIFLALLSVLFAGLYLLKISGLEQKISSVNELKDYLAAYGKFTVPAFIALQFLQVLILPIPSVVLHTVGVLIFGFKLGLIYSVVGIVSASVLAFFIGKKIGVKGVKWLIGEHNLNKGLSLLKGKDKALITLMFLFPFFPDDLLCFISGVVGVSTPFFIIMVCITRTLSITATTAFLSGKIFMPSNLWFWLFLLIFLSITIIICVVICKSISKTSKGF